MDFQALAALNQHYTQGCMLSQQAVMLELSGSVLAANQLFEQSSALIGNCIIAAQQSGTPVLDNVFFVCACAHFNAARTASMLGWSHVVPNHLNQAQIAIGCAVTLNPRSFQYHSAAGMLYAAQGDLSAAVSEFQQALQLNPSDSGSLYMLSFLSAAQGDIPNGNQYYRLAAQTIPNLPPPQQLMPQLRTVCGSAPVSANCGRLDTNQLLKTIGDVASCINTIGGLFSAGGGTAQSGDFSQYQSAWNW
jgi:tetratricopeptide (TPR) repeat protein